MSETEPSRRQFLRLGSATLAVGVAGCNAPSSAAGSTPDGSPTPTDSETGAGVTETGEGESTYTRVYRDAIPSVVLVETGQGQGTGFQYDDEHVVTNAHVAGRASSTQVRYHDGTWSSGDVRGTDPHSDLAVVAVDSKPSSANSLPFVESAPMVGQEVVAIGNPYGLDGTVTTGIVSGTDRLIPAPTGYRIPDAIQTDAPVNPGNSGGPLMSLDGRVVGVINSKRGDNIAFGISAALTRRVVPELIESGDYDHAYMGVTLESVTPSIADANGMSEPRGLLVVRTVGGGPADGRLRESDVRVRNGSRVPVGGDVLLAVEGTTMHTFEDLASYLSLRTRPGDTVRVTVLRDGQERTVDLTLDARPEQSRSPLQ